MSEVCSAPDCNEPRHIGKTFCTKHYKDQEGFTYGMDADMQSKIAAKYDSEKARQAQEWIEKVTGNKVDRLTTLQEALKSGVVLCELINKIKPGIVPKINVENTPFKQRENIANYIKACRELGMQNTDVFVAQDLYEGDNMVVVITNLFQLGSLAQLPEIGFNGPHFGNSSKSYARTDASARKMAASQAPETYLHNEAYKQFTGTSSFTNTRGLGVDYVPSKEEQSCSVAGCSKKCHIGKDMCLDHFKERGNMEFGMDAELKAKQEAKENANQSNEHRVREWLSKLGKQVGGSLQEALKSGVILCEVVNLIVPGSVPRINQESTPFKQRENIANYVEACRKIGMQDAGFFVAQDLFEGDNMVLVVDNLNQLGSIAKLPEIGFGGPHLDGGVSNYTLKKKNSLAKPTRKPRVLGSFVNARGYGADYVPGSNEKECSFDGCTEKCHIGKEFCLEHFKEQGDMAFGMDVEIKAKQEAKENANKDNEARVREWIEALVGNALDGTLAEALKTGVVLCTAINVIKPSSIKKVHKLNSPFKHRENIANFLTACKALGMRESDCFSTAALYEGQNIVAVTDCILQLGNLVKASDWFDGPVMAAPAKITTSKQQAAQQEEEAAAEVEVSSQAEQGQEPAGGAEHGVSARRSSVLGQTNQRVTCTECSAPLKPSWAKFCTYCGKSQRKSVLLKRANAFHASIAATTKTALADKAEEDEFTKLVREHKKEQTVAAVVSGGQEKKSLRQQAKRRSFSEVSLEEDEDEVQWRQAIADNQARIKQLRESKRSQPASFGKDSVLELARCEQQVVKLERQLAHRLVLRERALKTIKEAEAPMVLARQWREKLKEEYAQRHAWTEELEDVEAGVWKLRYRQQSSPWMMSKRQNRLLERMERQEQLLRIRLLQLEIDMEEKKGEEDRVRQELAAKKPELEELNIKAAKPWLMTQEDNDNLADLKAAIQNLENQVADIVDEQANRQEQLAEMEAVYEGRKQKSDEQKDAEQTVKDLRKLTREKKKRQKELQELFSVTPWKCDVQELRTVSEEVETLSAQLKLVPKAMRQSKVAADKVDAECTKCNAPIASSSRFCLKCGVRQNRKTKHKCPGCEKPLSSGNRFCVGCGHNVEDVTRGSGHQEKLVYDSSYDTEYESDYSDDDDNTPIVIDFGSYSLKAGFAVSDRPSLELKSTIAFRNEGPARGPSSDLWDVDYANIVFGDQLFGNSVDLSAMHRVNHNVGNFSNWDDMETVLIYALDRLQVDLTDIEQPLLMTQPAFGAKAARSQLAEMLFETFNFPAVTFQPAPVLAAYSYGDATALVIDIGDEVTQVVPVVQGCLITHAVMKVRHISGGVASQLLKPVVEEYAPGGLSQFEITHLCQEIKHKLGFVVEDSEVYDEGRQDDEFCEEGEVTFRGESLEFQAGANLLDVGELFFQPKTILDDQDESILSLPDIVANVLKQCSYDTRRMLVENIVLSGGGTKLHGFADRLATELKHSMPHLSNSIKVRADKHRQYAAWTGGSVLASIESFQQQWVSNWDYAESGWVDDEEDM